jgi:hypothetical protein
MNVYLYFVLLALVSGYALLKGGREERFVAAVCVAASVGTLAIFRPADVTYTDFQPRVAVIDLAVLAAFVGIALRTRRFWPLWVSGLQLTTTIGHVLKLLDPQLVPVVYGAALASWSYPILLILAVGTWRAQRVNCSQRELTAQ